MLAMIHKILKDRNWKLAFSWSNRHCYISGENLWFKLSYRGRKQIYSIIAGRYSINDDIWLSQSEYLYRLSRNQI